MIDAMSDFPESHRDLLGAQVATLATLEPDGQPQLSEIWFLYDEGEIRLSLNTSRRKTQNLTARDRCTLLILDLKNPVRYLEIRGRARIGPTTTTRSPTSCTASTAPTSPPTTSRATGGWWSRSSRRGSGRST